MIKNYFIMLPNNTVWAYEDGEITLINDYDKLLIAMIYLDTHVNNIGECCFTLEDLIIKSGLNLDRGKGRSIEQFKNTLIFLQSLGWLDSTLDIKNLKPKEFINCKYEVQFKKEDVTGNNIYYFKLYYDKFKKIMDNDSKLDKLITLKIYCYIIARIRRNNSDQQDMRDSQYWDGTVIECFYDSYKSICNDLNTTDTTFNTHLQLLKELELTFFDNIGLVKDEYSTHYANNIYAETEDWLKQGLKASKEYYIGQGYELIGKKCSKTTTTIKGYKGQIEKQTNEGKDTKELEQKVEELIEAPTDNIRVVKTKRKCTGNIVKKLAPPRPNDASFIISCQEDNYNEISRKIENGQDDWGITNPYESSLKEMFGDDTYKMDIPKNEIQTNQYEKYIDKEYEDFIDSLL